MTCRAVQVSFCAGLVAAALTAGWAASDEPPKAQPDPKNDKAAKGAESDDQYRKAAEKIISSIDMEMLVNEKWVKVKRVEKPLLYYGDPTRDNDRGSLWGWGEKGRPVALLELYQNVNDRTKWVYALCNTSGGMLRAKREGEYWWRANESASDLKDIPGAPIAAGDAAQRQRQLKGLAQKFTGHQFWDPNNSRYELRRLDRPLRTYKDEENGILEGGLYALANGTNPEIMLFIEARTNPKDATKPVWQFTVGRLAHAELHMLYDEREVFEAPRGNKVAGSNKPYWLGFIETPEAKREPNK
jgi:hypothetical protein